MLYFICFCFQIILIGSVKGFAINRTLDGYPISFLPECPGTMKPAIISPQSRRFVEIYAYGLNSPISKPREFYNYNTIGRLANDTTIDWSKPILMYVPGWMDNIHQLPMSRIMKVLYRRLGYNVFVLNILKFMTEEWPVTVRAMIAIGDVVGEMLAKLMEIQPRFDPKKFELIGNSLGGHTMSFIAKSFKKRTGVKFSRMTGMDPAGPCFRHRGPEGRVDESDADFVDLILTNIDTFGMASPVGHVNIYVNGGEFQPGEAYWMVCGPFCSHSRSSLILIFAMLFHDGFIAVKCDSVQDARDNKCYDRKPMETITVGPKMDRKARGIYYLPTTNFPPYIMGQRGLKKENNFVLNKLRKMNAKDVLVY